jgi:hypothetical protein
MLTFKDFTPQWRGQTPNVEDTQAVLTRLNHWLNDEAIEIVTIETLIVAPKQYRNDQIPTSIAIPSQNENGMQVFRVWYMLPGSSAFPATGETQRLDPNT